MILFSRFLDLLPGRRSVDQAESNTNNREKSRSNGTDETRTGTHPGGEEQEEGGLTEAQVDNFDRRRNVRTLPRKLTSEDLDSTTKSSRLTLYG